MASGRTFKVEIYEDGTVKDVEPPPEVDPKDVKRGTLAAAPVTLTVISSVIASIGIVRTNSTWVKLPDCRWIMWP